MTDKPTKVLFLDIDGVLNSQSSAMALGGYPHSFDGYDLKRFDWVSVGLIRLLCGETKTSIVLSSSWRILHSVIEVANGLDLPVIDKTPVLSGYRGTEIQDWLDRHPEVLHYAIVDDDSDMLSKQKKCFVKTNPLDGLQFKHYKRLKEILNDPSKGLPL